MKAIRKIFLAGQQAVDLAAGLPLLQAVFQIRFEAVSALVSFLGGFRQQLHHNIGNGLRHGGIALMRRRRNFGNVTVHQFQRIVGIEGHASRQHFIKRHAQRVKVRAIIQRAIHAPGLLWRHISQRAGEQIGVADLLAFLRQARGHAEINDLDLIRLQIDDDIRGREIFVDEVVLMQHRKRIGKLNTNIEESRDPDFFRIEEPAQQHTADVFQNQSRPLGLTFHSVEFGNALTLQMPQNFMLMVQARTISRFRKVTQGGFNENRLAVVLTPGAINNPPFAAMKLLPDLIPREHQCTSLLARPETALELIN
ncbi:MAG: hypothetical protein ALAOOOJD_02542 [bacterium]|nr:hypothetical protein [bacterium]